MGLLNDDTRNNDLINDDILRIIKEFEYATELSIKTGYDGIEIHAANNFKLLNFEFYLLVYFRNNLFF